MCTKSRLYTQVHTHIGDRVEKRRLLTNSREEEEEQGTHMYVYTSEYT